MTASSRPTRTKQTMPAKAMRYAGVQMRSRLEALFAAEIDCMGLEWHYEPCRLFVGEQSWLPDFIVARFIYVEVKPTEEDAYGCMPFLARCIEVGYMASAVFYDGHRWCGASVPGVQRRENAHVEGWPPQCLLARSSVVPAPTSDGLG